MADILSERDGAVHRIVLNRPERLNTLSHSMIDELIDALEAAVTDDTCRVVHLRGEGRGFCAGDDLKGMGEAPPRRWKGRKLRGQVIPQQLLIETLRSMPRPVVAQVHGFCLGMGFDLALACDIRVCTETAEFGDPRAERALYAATGITYQLPRVVGYGRALEMMMLAERIDGREAQRIGVVYRAVPEDQLDHVVESITERLATGATSAIAAIKEQLREQVDLSYEAARAHSTWIRNTYAIEDTAEGVASFLEKRRSRFTGR